MPSLREKPLSYDSVAAEWDAARQSPWGEFNFARHLLSAHSILDAGCGNGRLVRWLRTEGFHGDYLGIDSSIDLLAKAQKNFPKEIFLQADLSDFTSRRKFSAVFCVAVLHHLPDAPARLRALRGLYSALEPEGELFLTVWNLWQPRYLLYILKSFFTTTPRNCSLPFFGKGTRLVHAFTAGELLSLCEQAGFQSVRVFPACRDQQAKIWRARNFIVLAKK